MVDCLPDAYTLKHDTEEVECFAEDAQYPLEADQLAGAPSLARRGQRSTSVLLIYWFLINLLKNLRLERDKVANSLNATEEEHIRNIPKRC
jgi:hypothetical protein